MISQRTKILYGLGGIGNALKNSLFALFAIFFYTSVKGLPGSLVGAAAMIGLMADLALDPVIGHFADHARSPRARQAFMIAGSLTMGLGFWALFSPPAGLTQIGLFAWLLVTSLAGRIGMAAFTIPYFSFGAQLSHDYRERTSISAIRGILILVSTLVAASLSFVLFFPNVTPGIDPKLNGGGYFWMGLVFGIVISATGIVSVLGTGREAAAARELVPPREASSYSPAYLLASLRNPSFRLIIASFFLFFMGVVFNSALAIHYLTYYTGIGSSAALSSFQLAFYLGSVVGLVAWLKLARRADKHVLYGCAALASAVLMLGAVLLVGEGRLLGTGSVRVMLIGHWLGGCLTSIVWFIPQSMIADVCDEEELVSGERREGMFFGLFYLARQLAVGLTSLLAGVLLDWFAGLQPGAVAQSGRTVSRIGILFGVYPAIALALGGVLMLRYTLSARRVAAIRVELNNRRGLAACR